MRRASASGLVRSFPMATVLLTAAMLAVPRAIYADEHDTLEGKRVAILLGEGVHDGEALIPMAYLVNRGAEVTVVGPETGTVDAYNSDIQIVVEKRAEDVSADDFDALVIPGGRSPANIRENDAVVELTREMVEAGKPVAAICHGPQLLVTAGVMGDVRTTGVRGIADELRAAGAHFVDAPVVEHDNIITSRLPGDLPVFSEAIVKAIKERDENNDDNG